MDVADSSLAVVLTASSCCPSRVLIGVCLSIVSVTVQDLVRLRSL